MRKIISILLLLVATELLAESAPIAELEVTPWAYTLNGKRSEEIGGLSEVARDLEGRKWLVYTAPCIDRGRIEKAKNMAGRHSNMNYEVVERDADFCH